MPANLTRPYKFGRGKAAGVPKNRKRPQKKINKRTTTSIVGGPTLGANPPSASTAAGYRRFLKRKNIRGKVKK